MLFNTPVFILGFLPIALAGFFLLGRWAGRRAALWYLAGASLFFYGWWNPPFVLLLAGSIGANYGLGQAILHARLAGRTRQARLILIAGLALDLGLLGWFKYAHFLAASLAALAGWPAPHWHIFLPLAISFFTFQQVMFLVDSFRADRADAGLLAYANFIAFFPHLISGPIVRPKDIIPQFQRDTVVLWNTNGFTEGLDIFLLGLAKKLVLADTFGGFADVGFAAANHAAPLGFFEAWYALLAYALQIYFDFSGYSDMAIGLARMFGIRFPLNFTSPYKSRNIREFWQHWNMTLSFFLRDYLYIPLGGNRHGEGRRIGNLMATMLLGGLWHGAGWTFITWGGLHGAYLVIHGWFRRLARPLPAPFRPIGRLGAHALTLLAVILAWVPFRASGLPACLTLLRGLAGLNGIALPRLMIRALPALGWIARPVPVLPYLGDTRTLAFPEITACLALGWFIVLALPHLHQMSAPTRRLAVAGSFAFAMQALFFAPAVIPFLYFQF